MSVYNKNTSLTYHVYKAHIINKGSISNFHYQVKYKSLYHMKWFWHFVMVSHFSHNNQYQHVLSSELSVSIGTDHVPDLRTQLPFFIAVNKLQLRYI